MGQNHMPIIQFHFKHGVRERLQNLAFDLYGVFFGQLILNLKCQNITAVIGNRDGMLEMG